MNLASCIFWGVLEWIQSTWSSTSRTESTTPSRVITLKVPSRRWLSQSVVNYPLRDMLKRQLRQVAQASQIAFSAHQSRHLRLRELKTEPSHRKQVFKRNSLFNGPSGRRLIIIVMITSHQDSLFLQLCSPQWHYAATRSIASWCVTLSQSIKLSSIYLLCP